MKKQAVSLVLVTSLALTSFLPYAAAETKKEAAEQARDVYLTEQTLEKIHVLDLNIVLDRALNRSYNLALLMLKEEALSLKSEDVTVQMYEMTPRPIPKWTELPDTPAEMVEFMASQGVLIDPAENLWLGPVTSMSNYAINRMFSGMEQMMNGMNSVLIKQRQQLESAIQELQTERLNTELQQLEAKEGVRLQMISQYAQLLGLKEKLDFMEEVRHILEKERTRAEAFLLAGLASKEDVLQAERMLEDHKDQMELVQREYWTALAQLCFDIGIEFQPDLVLTPLNLENIKPVVRKEAEKLLASSYEMMRHANSVDGAEWLKNNSFTITSKKFGEKNKELVSKQNEQKQRELTKRIETVYAEAEEAYLQMLSAQKAYERLIDDAKKVAARQELGVMSKHDAERFMLQVKQAKTALVAAQLQYYVLKERADAMERGLIA